jgi:CheY-like chemotaxis protein
LKYRILIVDDQVALADTLRQILERHGYECAMAHTGKQALDKLTSFYPDLVLSDVIMPGMDGIEFARVAQNVLPGCPILLCSGNATTQELIENAEADGESVIVLPKPIAPRDLLAQISLSIEASMQAGLKRAAEA